MKHRLIVIWIAALAAACAALSAAGQSALVLENGLLRAEFGERGLLALEDPARGVKLDVGRAGWAVTVNRQRLSSDHLRNAEVKMEPSRLTYSYVSGDWALDLVFELKPGWRFVSKHLVISSAANPTFHVDKVEAFAGQLTPPPAGELLLAKGAFGALLRFDAGSGGRWSAFLLLQNPFLEWHRDGRDVTIAYTPDMDWQREYGPFVTDRLCLGLQELSGRRVPAQAVPEWKYVPDYGRLLRESPTVDVAEVDALTECVRAFLLWRPGRSVRVHVPWCENDYQIDVGLPEGADEYRRIMDRAAELGVSHLLFTPANSQVSSLSENADAWGWENLLFFGLGQKIRKGVWNPKIDPVPPSVQSLLDYAAAKPLRLLAYAYPSLPFKQDPEWTKWAGDKVSGTRAVDTGLRSFQDWWLETLADFLRKTGGAGFSFDHWWIAYDGASSKYAQWFGCRRILESLRRDAPAAVIDGRQQYQNFGPWTWLAGSYPHPSLTDEQPESFTAFPDLSTDRISANRQRFAAWTYRVERFCPPETMPGFITHQSERSDEKDVMRRDRFRPRDWDVLGWKYSLLSSIATAPFNHVVNYIPARDPDEFRLFSEEDKAFFRRWLDWTDSFAEYLRHVRPILGPPMVGRIDGTAAIRGDGGFVFLFNPNQGRLEARITLDETIGLVKGDRFMVRELFPEEGKLLSDGREPYWGYGREVVVPMGGCEARVLEVSPPPVNLQQPLLFNAAGVAELRSGRLLLHELSGEVGTERELLILLPKAQPVRSLTANNVNLPFVHDENLVSARVRFPGKPFGRSERVGTYEPGFIFGTFAASFSVPARVFKQLADRKIKWPVPYADDDLRAPWLGPHRLLLYVQVAEPSDAMNVTAKLDAKPLPLRKAYNSVYGHAPERTFLGWYADISDLKPDVTHQFEVSLPQLAAGQFQGVFLANVEPEYTRQVSAVSVAKKAPPAKKK